MSTAHRRLSLMVLATVVSGLLGLPAPLLPNTHSATDTPAIDTAAELHSMGELVCAPLPDYCLKLWKSGMERGKTFNLLISDVCLNAGVREDQDAGIRCVHTAIGGVPWLPQAALVEGQFAPGERESNPIWAHRSDKQWGDLVVVYFGRIPNYCDRTTPEIFDYFPCLLRRVHFFQSILKNYRMSWYNYE